MIASQAARASPQRSLGTEAQKTTFEPIRVPKRTVETFRKSEPKFCQYLEETGQVIIEEMPCQTAGARENGIRETSH